MASNWRADLALGGIALVWGATFVVVKEALRDASTLAFLSLRFTLATLALGLAFRPLAGKFRGRILAKGGVAAGLCLFAGYLFQTWGLRYTTPSKSAFLTGLSIVMVPVFGAALRRQWPERSEWLGVAAATAGMALLTLEAGPERINRGDLLTLLCAAGFALHILAVGHWAPRANFQAFTLVQIATAAALASLSCWWVEAAYVRWSLRVAAALGVTSLLATALAFSVQAWAQQRTTPTRTALIFALEPVFAWMTSALLTGERLGTRQALGAALILAGVLQVELKPLRAGVRPSQ